MVVRIGLLLASRYIVQIPGQTPVLICPNNQTLKKNCLLNYCLYDSLAWKPTGSFNGWRFLYSIHDRSLNDTISFTLMLITARGDDNKLSFKNVRTHRSFNYSKSRSRFEINASINKTKDTCWFPKREDWVATVPTLSLLSNSLHTWPLCSMLMLLRCCVATTHCSSPFLIFVIHLPHLLAVITGRIHHGSFVGSSNRIT